MGDRGNIVMDFGDGKEVFFYTHWSGSDIGAILKAALKKEERWDDGPYLARIIFQQMTKGSEGETTGYGISPFMCDNEHNLLVVSPHFKTVTERTESGKKIRSWTFGEFIGMNYKEEENG